jgi:hypothetical protein
MAGKPGHDGVEVRKTTPPGALTTILSAMPRNAFFRIGPVASRSMMAATSARRSPAGWWISD